MRIARRILAILLVIPSALVLAQDAPRPTATEASDSAETGVDDLIRETQQTIGGKNRTGVVWWIPVEFWEASFRAQGMTGDATERFKALRDYTMVIIVGGNISGLGSISWLDAAVLREHIRLKDAAGNLYEPHKTVQGDAGILAGVIRPILANALGTMGEHMQVFMFPAQDAAGKNIADPTRPGSFSIILNEISGFGASSHEWRLPLTSLSPPKFCPTGKERLQANWKFCPWHGTPLSAEAAPRN